MEFPFTLEGFSKRRLAIRLAGLFGGAKLVVDGADLVPVKGKGFELVDDLDRPRRILLKPSFFDAVPQIQLDDQKPKPIVAGLAWYEMLWLALPFGLVVAGGALGGAAGAVGLMVNTRIFRTRQGLCRYGLTAIVTCLAALGYVLLAVLFHLAVGSSD